MSISKSPKRFFSSTTDGLSDMSTLSCMIPLELYRPPRLRFRRNGINTDFSATFSANRYGTLQEQDKIYREPENHLSLQSTLTEYILSVDLRHLILHRFIMSEGGKLRRANFQPGQLNELKKRTDVLLATGWLQMEYSIPDRLYLKAVGRVNHYRNYNYQDMFGDAYWQQLRMAHLGTVSTLPEMSLSAKWHFTPKVAIEATYDHTLQYYHTLEGLPVGWSLDMMLPSGGAIQGGMADPEEARQGNVALSAAFGDHSISVGGFYKEMNNLLYFKYAQSLFSGAMASWEDYTYLGKGTSYGMETLYEYVHEDWYARVAYTLSKTTRHGFMELNEGKPFHARFDRRHVLNATLQWKGFSAALIVQSGHWENGEAETYMMPMIGTEDWEAQYFSGYNNYHMPTVFRLDIGWQTGFKTGHLEHKVNVGICNVSNHFNPFMLYFDTRTESWKEIALLPILPNFSWRVEF